MSAWGGFWIMCGLAFAGLAIDNGLTNIANKISYLVEILKTRT